MELQQPMCQWTNIEYFFIAVLPDNRTEAGRGMGFAEGVEVNPQA